MNKTTLEMPEHLWKGIAEIITDYYLPNEFETLKLHNNIFPITNDLSFIDRIKKIYNPNCEEL